MNKMKKKDLKRYFQILCLQNFIYGLYILVGNYMHSILGVKDTIRIKQVMGCAEKIFFVYIVSIILTSAWIWYKNEEKLSVVIGIISVYYAIHFMVTYTLEVILNYIYHKKMSYMIQTGVLVQLIIVEILFLKLKSFVMKNNG